MFGMIGSIVGSAINGISNYNTNKQNQANFDTNRNDVINNNMAANQMLQNFSSGKDLLDGMFDGSVTDGPFGVTLGNTNLISDMLNPYLALNSQKLQQQSMDLNQEQFKYSKYVSENSAQIRAKDFEKAGFSPLLAVGGSATYSPVSTGSSGATSNKQQSAMQNPNTQQALNIALNTALGKEMAEIDVLKSQAKKIDAETATELGRPANISADTKLKENQSIKTTEETKLLREQITSELYKQGLTKNQIEFYAVQIQTLEHNLNESIKNGIRTSDQMPFVFSEIQNIIEAMGINPDSNLGKYLTAGSYALLLYQGARVKAPTINKYNYNTTNKHYNTINK